MIERDFVPPKDSDFSVWFDNLTATVMANTLGQNAKWLFIPKSESELLAASNLSWHGAYNPTLKPHLPAQTLAKNEARIASEAVIRPFVGQWLMWKQVTDMEREEMGLHNKQPRRPAIPAPVTVPKLEPRAGVPRQVVISYRDKDSSHRGKPDDVHGIEVRWVGLDHPPKDIETELLNSAFDTKSPLTLNFQEHERGRRIYMAGRWEIEREGVKGLFGDIETVIIP
jgi:hypothetical protein